MKQAEAKQIAETLLYRRVKMKQNRGMCMIFPATTKGRFAEFISFSKTTDYYGHTWDECIVKIQDHVRFDVKTGQPIEGEMIRCPNCGDSESLDFNETTKQFTCEVCEHKWNAQQGMDIVAESIPPSINRDGQVAGSILISPTDKQEEPDNDIDKRNANESGGNGQSNTIRETNSQTQG